MSFAKAGLALIHSSRRKFLNLILFSFTTLLKLIVSNVTRIGYNLLDLGGATDDRFSSTSGICPVVWDSWKSLGLCCLLGFLAESKQLPEMTAPLDCNLFWVNGPWCLPLSLIHSYTHTQAEKQDKYWIRPWEMLIFKKAEVGVLLGFNTIYPKKTQHTN